MFKGLRRKFVVTAMSAVLLVLTLLICSILLANYRTMISKADETVGILLDNGGSFPLRQEDKTFIDENPNRSDDGTNMDATEKKNPPRDGRFSVETPYETRYFTVKTDTKGNILSVNTGSIAAISTEDAINYTKEVLKKDKEKGFADVYRYGVATVDDEQCIVFVDCGRDLDFYNSFLKICLGMSFLGIVGVFLLVLLFSSRAIKPVVESYQKQKHFITDAGHELKTPLAVISANTEVLELTDGENEWTKSIKNQVERLSVLTNELIALSRMDEAGESIAKETFSLSDALTEVAESFRMAGESNERTFDTEIQENISYYGNEGEIRKMAIILCDNAIKYTPPKGAIHFTLKKEGKNILFCLKNTATAMEKGRHDEVFERFYRGDSSRSSEISGYGIGLSIAKSVVMAHKGKIHAESPDENHFAITITLT